MRKNQLILILLTVLALLPLSSAYSLEGKWTLTNHKDFKLDPSIEMEFQFKKDIKDKTSITHQLIVKACYQLSYSYEIRQNDIVFNYQKIIDIPRKCVDGEITSIRAKLDTVFYFTIDGPVLKLYNPTGFAPFSFRRKQLTPLKAINGLWQTLRVHNAVSFVNVQVNGSHALLCNGQGVAVYRISGLNQILFTILQARGCSEKQMKVLNALDSTNFFRIRDNSILYLYDTKVTQVLTANFNGPLRLNQPLISRRDTSNPQIQPLPTTQTVPQTQVPQVQPSQSNQTTLSQNFEQTQTPQVQPTSEQNKTTNSLPPRQQNPHTPQQQPLQPSQQPPINTSQAQVSNSGPRPIRSTGAVPPMTPFGPNPNSTRVNIPPVIISANPIVITNRSIPLPSTQQNHQNITEIPLVLIPQQAEDNSNQQISISELDQTEENDNTTDDNNKLSIDRPPEVNNTIYKNSTFTESAEPTVNQSTESTPEPDSLSTEQQNDTTSSPPLETQSVVILQNTSSAVNNAASSASRSTLQSPSDLIPFEADSLDGKWFLRSIDQEPISSDLRSYYLIVSSSNKRAILYGGCNVQFGSFALDGNGISFSGIIGTKKACQVNKDGEITQPMFEQSQYIEIVNSQLVFYDKDLKQKIVYTTTPPL